jgi:hypothetical protein
MSERGPRRAHGAPIWGVILLFLGILFLLQALDVIPWGVWGTLWRFWPVLIIIIGLNIILGRYNRWAVTILAFALLWVCLGIAYWQYQPASVVQSYSEPLANLERASIAVDFDGGSLSLGSLGNYSANLVEVESSSRGGDGGIEAVFQQQDGEGSLHLTARSISRFFWSGPYLDWQAMFTQKIPLTFDIKSAASNISLDLSELLTPDVILELNAGSCQVTAPSSEGITHIKITANASNVEVTVPAGVAARISLDTNVSGIDIDKSRFPQSGDYYVSQDFGTNSRQVELEIKCNVGRVQVK